MWLLCGYCVVTVWLLCGYCEAPRPFQERHTFARCPRKVLYSHDALAFGSLRGVFRARKFAFFIFGYKGHAIHRGGHWVSLCFLVLRSVPLPHPKFNVGSRRASCDGVCTDIPHYLCKTYFGVVNTEATLSSGKSRRDASSGKSRRGVGIEFGKVKKGCELWEVNKGCMQTPGPGKQKG